MFCSSSSADPGDFVYLLRPSLLNDSCVWSSLQDVVNVVGGLGVLLPLLEQVCEAEPVCNGSQEISDLLGPELTSSRGPTAMLLPLKKSSGEHYFSPYFVFAIFIKHEIIFLWFLFVLLFVFLL